jgi:hypothetical protein
VASYCSDYIGYISSRLAHDEADRVPLEEVVDQKRFRRLYGTTTSPFAPEAGEGLVTAAVDLVAELE